MFIVGIEKLIICDIIDQIIKPPVTSDFRWEAAEIAPQRDEPCASDLIGLFADYRSVASVGVEHFWVI